MAHEFFTVTASGMTISATTTSTQAAIPNTSSGIAPRYVRVVGSAAAFVRLGIGSATATTNDFLVQPADSVTLHIPNGVTHIAAITSVGSALVNVVPLENL